VKIKAKTEYAYWALLDVALRSRGAEPVRLGEISERQHIPEKFLLQVMTSLRQAGLVKSIRGQHGGYVLARPAASITLADILRATGVEPAVMPFSPSRASAHGGSRSSLARLMAQVDAKTAKTLESITLVDACSLELSKEAISYTI